MADGSGLFTSVTGTGILLRNRRGQVLLGRGTAPPTAGQWRLPGGKTEGGESFEETAVRELAEETGIVLEPERVTPFAVVVDTMPEPVAGLTRVTVGLLAPAFDAEPRLTEPDKFDRWEWFDPAGLPAPLFAPTAHVLHVWRPESESESEPEPELEPEPEPAPAVPAARRYRLARIPD